jgi:hypothetical protein
MQKERLKYKMRTKNIRSCMECILQLEFWFFIQHGSLQPTAMSITVKAWYRQVLTLKVCIVMVPTPSVGPG